MDEPYEPREHDHLVEPIFGGLGARRQPPPARMGFARRLAAFVRHWLARLRP